MDSTDDSFDSNKINEILALTLQTPNHVEQDPRPAVTSKKLSQSQEKIHGQGKPRQLPNSKQQRKTTESAPDMGAVVFETPSQKNAGLARAVSYPGLPMDFDGGDTQPMPSQIYKDYASIHRPANGLDAHDSIDENAVMRDDLPYTLQEGDAGHIDLMNAWAPNTNGHVTTELSDDEEEKRDTQDMFSSLTKLQSYPKTPATIGQKRNRRGEAISPSTNGKTPGSGFSTVFGLAKAGPVMSNTQMFNMTQAESSPLPGNPRSDPADTRPSPDFVRLHNDTSPIDMNSPTKPYVSNSDPTEPRDMYLSVKESQERRRLRLREEQERQKKAAILSDIDEVSAGEDDEEDSEQKRQRRRRQVSEMDVKAKSSWLGVSAPSRPGSRSNMVKTTVETFKSPYSISSSSVKPRADVVIHLSDDAESDLDDASLEDEYDEYGQDVVPSQRDSSVHRDRSSLDPFEGTGIVDETHNASLPTARNIHRIVEASQNDVPGAHHTGTTKASSQSAMIQIPSDNILAVADSQPDRAASQPPPRPVEPSSMSSYVPGSQTGTISSHTRAMIEAKLREDDSSSLPKPPLTSQMPGTQLRDGPPSSPPVLPQHHDEEQQPTTADLIGEQRTPDIALSGNAGPTVPKSATTTDDTAMIEMHGGSSLSELGSSKGQQARAEVRKTTASAPPAQSINDATLFDTARTHLSESRSNIVQPSPRRSSRLVSESPRKAAGIRLLTDIATDPTPPEAKNASQDPDVDFGIDLMAVDDEVLDSTRHAPAERKGKLKTVYGKRAKRGVSQLSANEHGTGSRRDVPSVPPKKPSEPASSPVGPQRKRKRVHVAVDDESPAIADAAGEEPVHNDASAANDGQPVSTIAETEIPSDVVTTIADTGGDHSTSVSTGVPMVQRASTPNKDELGDSTPPSVRKREEAGNKAASRARDAIFAAKGVKGRKTAASAKRKGRSRLAQDRQSESEASLPNTAALPAHFVEREIAETPMSNHRNSRQPNEDLPDANDETSAPAQVIEADQESNHDHTEGADTNDKDPPCPNRILALFKGNMLAYYPATCIGTPFVDGSRKYLVRFDDGTITTIEDHLICSFDVKVGDMVKVDLPKMRNKVYIIVGFADRIDTPGHEATSLKKYPLTDRTGYLTALLQPKQRDSLPRAAEADQEVTEPVRVPMGSIYVTTTMWSNFSSRHYLHSGQQVVDRTNRISTPSTDMSAPVTPKSRSRRNNSLLGLSHGPTGLAIPFLGSSGCFSGMAFAVSYLGNDETKDRVINLIQQHGGRLLETGFTDLFHLPDLSDSVPTSPIKDNGRSLNEDHQPQAPNLSLTGWAQALGFTALITDKHSRREKYMQALALSLPCLSGRWILDSIAASTPLPIARYVLAAGESQYLDGAVRSRSLLPVTFDPSTTKLTDVIANRSRLLQGGRVLLVQSGNKAKWEKSKVYAFLSLALGAERVRRVDGPEAAARVLKEERGMWRFVHCDVKAEKALVALVGGASSNSNAGSAAAGGKRKRGQQEEVKSATAGDVIKKGEFGLSCDMGDFRIVGDEFVIQSLILGELIEG